MQIVFFILSLQVIILILGIQTSRKSFKDSGVRIYPKSIKVYLSLSLFVSSIYILINYEVKEFLLYATMIFVGVTISTLGDMMIFHMIKFKKGNRYGIYILSLANYVFGMAILSLKLLYVQEYIWIGAICLMSFIILYLLKKIVLRKVYLWSIFYGQGIMFMVASSIFITIHNFSLGLITILSVTPALIGGVLIVLRSFFNVRFSSMAISLWSMYILQLLILTYSPIIIVLNRV